MIRALALLSVAALALAGCEKQVPTDGAGAQPAAVSTETSTTAPEAVEASTGPSPTPVMLDTGGLTLLDATGKRISVRFGAPGAGLDARIASLLRAPVTPGQLSECGAGPMRFATIGPLTLNYQNGTFVGWTAEQGDGIATSDGIRPGVMLSEVARERPVERLDTTLEGEFAYSLPGGSTMRGFADGPGDRAVVTSLYAGTTCFFR